MHLKMTRNGLSGILLVIGEFSKMGNGATDLWTDQQTDGRTDKLSYFDARVHLKKLKNYWVSMKQITSLRYYRIPKQGLAMANNCALQDKEFVNERFQ